MASVLPQKPFYKKYSIILKALAIGAILGLIYAVITDAGSGYEHLRLLPSTVVGVTISFMVITLERSLRGLNNLPFITTMLLKALIYGLSILVFLLCSVVIFAELLSNLEYKEAVSTYIYNRLPCDFLFSIGASVFLILFLEISSLLSSRFFYNYFTGRYHRPVQENRIFMFVDVKSSTTIAEQLGDIKYSGLLQDLFSDFTSAILDSRAEIYQYAGDEIILTWKTPTGLKDQRCLYCFYLLKQSIRQREAYYEETYNLVPRFKAGMHIGTAVTAWVGKVKKEIVYHGDLLNTASRIQSKCNELNHDFVISEEMKRAMPQNLPVIYTHKGEISLRGKAQPIKLYTVDFNIGN